MRKDEHSKKALLTVKHSLFVLDYGDWKMGMGRDGDLIIPKGSHHYQVRSHSARLWQIGSKPDGGEYSWDIQVPILQSLAKQTVP